MGTWYWPLLLLLYLGVTVPLYAGIAQLYGLDQDPALLWLGVVHLATQLVLVLALAPWDYVAPSTATKLAIAAGTVGVVMATPTAMVLENLWYILVRLLGGSYHGTTWVLLVLGWLAWSGGLYLSLRRRDRLALVRIMAVCVAAAGLFLMIAGMVLVLVMEEGRAAYAVATLGLGGGYYLMSWSLGPELVYRQCRANRKKMKGRCLACGYQLRGLSAMRCPECGRPIT